MYGEGGKKVFFQKSDSLLQIMFKENLGENEKRNIILTINPKYTDKSYQINRMIVEPDKNAKYDISEFKKNNGVVYVNQSLINSEGKIVIPTNKVMVQIKKNYTIENVIKILDVNVEKYRRLGYNERAYLIILKDGESINTANRLFETGFFDYAQPSLTEISAFSNTYFDNQWALNNTGQSGGTTGIDIKAVNAWNITTGSNNISVAVIDQGVDLTHPDLEANLLMGYDATVGAPGGVNGSPFGNNAHGTACAGIIGAIENTIGIKGVVPNCRIIPIRNGYTTIYGVDVIDPDWAVDAINHAWEISGADILSCSWNISTYTALTNEIQSAVTLGRQRNGVRLGCVVVFAAGNNNQSNIPYPASLNDVISVGAISQCGSRKRSNNKPSEVNPGVTPDPLGVSCDEEKWWGSNYGQELDVVAPGVKIYTTDIQGSNGYNTSTGVTGNYFDSFNGTSAACPHVAGIAALVLSVNPCLTQQ
ncbi:MAG: hypothetical protein BGO29_05180 [Bacteroidales bacterium 36-12]|nr:MAG: hypothetical protein BGO29_05180 [Bacteroidales bacterium 36-12]